MFHGFASDPKRVRLSAVRPAFVVPYRTSARRTSSNLDGRQKSDGEASHALSRIFRRAGLPVRYWHTLSTASEPTLRCSA
jgi:hypothetical protein